MHKIKVFLSALVFGALIFSVNAQANNTAPNGVSSLVSKVSPSVVFISVKVLASASSSGPQQPPDEDEDGDSDGPNPPGAQHAPQREKDALGSGFIISDDGLIVTNRHVVHGAYEVLVTLKDGSKYKAKVLGTDERMDLAAIKIDAGHPLPFVKWADSSKAKVGDPVVAIGNPFGLSQTVTSGVISAEDRNIGNGPFDSYLQVDASINRGNSGGPLFDANGDVVGVNTAIYSPSGGSVGIGFSIPSNLAKNTIEILATKGFVEYAQLGVQIQPVTNKMAKALGLDKAGYAFVTSVLPDSSAQGKLKEGDVITKFNGMELKEDTALPKMVLRQTPNTVAKIDFVRDGAPMSTDITLKMVRDKVEPPVVPDTNYTENRDTLGMVLKELTPQVRTEIGIPSTVHGVLVDDVKLGEAAAGDLVPGVVIIAIDGKDVNTINDVKKAIQAGHAKRAILVKARKSRQLRFLALDVP
jgi:serine protease Do